MDTTWIRRVSTVVSDVHMLLCSRRRNCERPVTASEIFFSSFTRLGPSWRSETGKQTQRHLRSVAPPPIPPLPKSPKHLARNCEFLTRHEPRHEPRLRCATTHVAAEAKTCLDLVAAALPADRRDLTRQSLELTIPFRPAALSLSARKRKERADLDRARDLSPASVASVTFTLVSSSLTSSGEVFAPMVHGHHLHRRVVPCLITPLLEARLVHPRKHEVRLVWAVCGTAAVPKSPCRRCAAAAACRSGLSGHFSNIWLRRPHAFKSGGQC
jgi:hypothetical protein